MCWGVAAGRHRQLDFDPSEFGSFGTGFPEGNPKITDDLISAALAYKFARARWYSYSYALCFALRRWQFGTCPRSRTIIDPSAERAESGTYRRRTG
jgi:hypothetical protein